MLAKKIPLHNFQFTKNFTLENERPNDAISNMVNKYQQAMKQSQEQLGNQNDDSELIDWL